MCVCVERQEREVERKRERGGGQIFKFDLVCTDTGREGGVWSERRGCQREHSEGRGLCSTVGLFYE